MSILQNALNRLGIYTAQQITEAVKREIEVREKWLLDTADAERWTVPDPIIYANQADLYRLSPILATALDVLMDDVGLSKFSVKRLVGDEMLDIPNHDFELLLRNPNPMDSGMEFLRDSTASYKLNGNAIWWLNRDAPTARPVEIWNIPYQSIKPIPDGRMYLSHYEYYPGNAKQPIALPVWQIVHFKTYNPHNRFVGLSPIESLAMTLRGDLGQRQTKTRMYTEYGGNPNSILAFKEWVPDDVWDDVKKEKRLAAMRDEMLMLRGTGDGVTWMSRAMSSKDAEFIENLRQNMRDVFNRMCPGLLAMLDENSTEANALAARATYDEKTLWKTLEVFAQKITSNILPAYETRWKLVGQFDDPRSTDQRLEMEKQKLFSESHTIEEIRREFYGDSPLGDERDNLLPQQINAQSGGIQEPPPNPFENRRSQSEDNEAVEIELIDTEDDENVSVKAVEMLKVWRRRALQGKRAKALSFHNSIIPAHISASIKARLPLLTNNDDIARLFDAQIERMKPKPKVDAIKILKGIELGVRALEARHG